MGSVLRVCLDCTAAYAVGIARCPHCGSERAVDQGADPFRGGSMPKITRHGGPSDAADIPDSSTDEQGGEQSSPTPTDRGGSSSRSETKPGSTPKTSSTGDSKRARTTARRTKPGGTGASTARSTGTDPTERTSTTDSDD